MNAPARAASFAAGDDRALSVVHVVRQFHPSRGGLEDVVANLAREQIRLGARARVVTLNRLFRTPDQTLPATDTFGAIPIRRIPFRGSTRYPIAPAVFRELDGADLVHVHAVDFFFDALALGRPLHGKPLVATTHGGFFHTQAFSGLKTLWFNGPTRLTANLYDAIVACSPSDARLFRAIAARKVEVIENGADLAKFGGASSPRPVKRIVTLGRFSSNKRLDRLVAAVGALVAKDPDWRLEIVGAESDWSAQALRALIASSGLDGKATLHVGLDDRGVAEIMRNCSIFASASEFEGFGVALIEAMSAGLASVVQPNAAFAGLAGRHASIRTVDFADPQAAAGAFLETHAALLAHADGARPRAAELAPYAWPSVAERYMAVYRRAVAARAGVAR